MTTFNARALSSTLASCFLFCAAFASRGVLNADGTLHTRGVREGELRVTVMPLDAPAYVLPVGSTRFVLELELDNAFVVTFEQAGCITKQLYFDTTVPADRHAASFTFPFKVTLDARDEKHAFAYAGPVGFVRYHHEVADFAYETDYTVLVDPSFGERTAELDRVGVDPIIVVPTALAAAVVTSGYHRPEAALPERVATGSMGTVAPMVAHIPLMVHRTGGGQEEVVILVVPADEVTTPVSPAIEAAAPVIVPLVIVRSSPVTVSLPPEVHVVEVKLVPPTDGSASLPMVVAITKTTPPSAAAGREEELIVEARRVTTIVRIHGPEGRTNEYRRVVNASGGTVFFKDGLNIPEHVYVTATGG